MTSIYIPESGYKPPPQLIDYTCFNKVNTIQDTIHQDTTLTLTFTYGLNNQRVKTVLSRNSTVERIKFFDGDYEEDSTSSGTKKYHYINSPTGLIGIFVSEGSADTLYHILADHLGSLSGVINAESDSVTYYSFNAWGIPRDPDDWTASFDGELFAGRGYTGHEHLMEFSLINMNGRVYDPVLGKFLSPDPYVQAPGYVGSFNRYAYCLNNPLIFVDETGYWWGIDDAIAAGVGFVGGYFGYAISTGNWGWKAVAAGGIGAAVAWVGWNTLGFGNAALAYTGGGAGSATTFSQGLTAVFGSGSGGFGWLMPFNTISNSLNSSDALKQADQNGWHGVWTVGAYSVSATLQISLKPGSVSNLDGLKQWAGVVLTDNISDNLSDEGILEFNSIHVGVFGYDKTRDDDRWGGFYTVFSPGLTNDQRFDMVYESVLGLSNVKDINYTYRKWEKSRCWMPNQDKWHKSGIPSIFHANTGKIGNFFQKAISYSDEGIGFVNGVFSNSSNIFDLLNIDNPFDGDDLFENWYNNHY